MKHYCSVQLLLLTFIINIVWSSDEESSSTEEDLLIHGEQRKLSFTKDVKSDQGDNSFWEHPIVVISPGLSKDKIDKPRYPVYDPSYPVWVPGYPLRPGTDPKNMYKYKPKENDVTLKFEKKYRTSGEGNGMNSREMQRFKQEVKHGDMTQLLASKNHLYQSKQYRMQDLGRRFVPQYPYDDQVNEKIQDIEDSSLTPKMASPELVLAVAKQSAALEAVKSVDPNEHVVEKDILRSGDYWNTFWKDDVADSVNVLRSSKRNKMESVTAKLTPGTPIYEYVSKLHKLYPKLLYVINKKE